MKRFLLFYGMIYYPSGGAGDFKKDFDTKEEAEEYYNSNYKYRINNNGDYTWGNILDIQTGKKIKLQ